MRDRNLNTRLRALLNATGDPSSTQYQLEYKKSTDSTYSKVLTAQPTTPTYVAVGTIASGIDTITPALPGTLQTHDILLLFVESANEPISISNQNGGIWTQAPNSPQGTGTAGTDAGTRLSVFSFRYNGTQGAPTVADPGDHVVGRILAVRGCITSGDPFDVTAGNVGVGRLMMEDARARCAQAGCYKLVLSSNLRREQAQKGVNLAKSTYFPRIAILANYQQMGDSGSLDGSPYEDDEMWTGNGLPLGHLGVGKRSYQVSASRSLAAQAEEQYKQAGDTIAHEVKEAFLNRQESEKNIFVAETAIRQAEENFRLNKELYHEQMATTTDVLDAQTLLTQARNNYYNALNDYHISRARLERAMGKKM